MIYTKKGGNVYILSINEDSGERLLLDSFPQYVLSFYIPKVEMTMPWFPSHIRYDYKYCNEILKGIECNINCHPVWYTRVTR